MTFIPFHQPWLGVPERLRLFLAWLLAIVSAGIAIVFAWTIYDHEGRADGNRGHRWIDFGGQWLMGRMILEGRGFELYHVTTQLEVLNRFYPVSDQAPDEKNRDSEELMSAFMIGESDDRGLADATYDAVFVAKEHWGWRLVRSNIGGPLYPPLQAVYYAPFAFLRPQPGYRAMQILSLVLVFVCGYLVYGLTHGRVWWPVASVAVMIFPGFGGAINLGQNPMLTLTLLLFGWRQLQLGRPMLAGICWGFLAFKPVWAASFLLVPLLSRRWTMAIAMVVTGILLGLFTLPFVGLQSWFDWLTIGRAASSGYAVIETWVFLSRDLIGLPRRILVNFSVNGTNPQPYAELASVLGTILWLSIPAMTIVAAVWHPRGLDRTTGPAPAFLLLGAYFSCYHFIYYDALQAIPGVTLLFARRDVRKRGQVPLCEAPFGPFRQWYLTPFSDEAPFDRQKAWFERVWNLIPLILLVAIIVLSYHNELFYPFESHVVPWDTFGLLLMWAWCGWTWLREPANAS